MTRPDNTDTIHRTLRVDVTAAHAFAVFTGGLATWWPPEYTWAGEVLDTIAIEPRQGGRCFERGPYGFQCDWGRVLVWDPPHKLVFTWQISPRREPQPDPAKASEVEVRFIAEAASTTRVEFEHRNLACHGEEAEAYRAALDSPEGWTYILDRYLAAVV